MARVLCKRVVPIPVVCLSTRSITPPDDELLIAGHSFATRLLSSNTSSNNCHHRSFDVALLEMEHRVGTDHS